MGLFGGSSRSTSNVQNNIDSSTRNFNQAGAAVALVGSNNTVTATDYGALALSNDNNIRVIDLVKDTKTGIFDLVKNLVSSNDEKRRQDYEFSSKSTDNAYALSKHVVDVNKTVGKESLNSVVNAAIDTNYYNDKKDIRFVDAIKGSSVKAIDSVLSTTSDNAYYNDKKDIRFVDAIKNNADKTIDFARSAMSNSDQQSIRSYQFAQGVKVQSQLQPDTVKVLAGVGLVFGLAVIYGINKR